MRIERTTNGDLTHVEGIYQEARAYQFQQSGYGWPIFERSFIMGEILEKRHYKIIDEKGQMVAVFSTVNTEPVIWDDSHGTEAIYLHRMAVRGAYRGQNIVGKILDWAMAKARMEGKKYIRVDTWANNRALTDYYQRLGFKWMGKRKLPPKSELPPHYHGIEVNVFEIKV